jgi:hypothetical protein
VTMETVSLSRPCMTRGVHLHAWPWPDASSSPEELLMAGQPKCLTRSLVGGYGFRALCHMSVGCSVWGAHFCRHPGALTSIACSCVAVCCSHRELDVLVEAVGERHLGWMLQMNLMTTSNQTPYRQYNYTPENDPCPRYGDNYDSDEFVTHAGSQPGTSHIVNPRRPDVQRPRAGCTAPARPSLRSTFGTC